MKEEPDSLSVPYNFARCFNDQCPQASKCLRHIAAQYNGADYLYITSVNPARYPADGHYGKTGYYRLYRGERGLMPKDQAYIKQLFRNKGIKEEPAYQRYTEEYIW